MLRTIRLETRNQLGVPDFESRGAFFLRAYLLQTHEMLFDAHHHAFVAWGGILAKRGPSRWNPQEMKNQY